MAMKKLLSSLSMMMMVFTAYAQSCPDDNHPHMIDLGLPSGTLWACCNVGASKPEEHGGYYAWGETEEKEAYNEVSYQYCTGENPNDNGWYDQRHYQDIGNDIAGTQYDVAHEKWGGSWVMPSVDKIKELFNNCTCTKTSINGVNGQKFTSKNNGTSIFLPAASLIYTSGICHYWSSTCLSSVNWAYCLFGLGWDNVSRAHGLTVRPVMSGTNRINLPGSSSGISNQGIYNLYGIKVADTIAETSALHPGLYIVDGRKIVVK